MEARRIDGAGLKGKIYSVGHNYITLGEEIGITSQSISNVVNGRNKPGHELIAKLIVGLDLSAEEIEQIFFKK